MPTYAIRLGSKASGLHFGDLIVIRMSSCYGCGRATLFESLEALLPCQRGLTRSHRRPKGKPPWDFMELEQPRRTR